MTRPIIHTAEELEKPLDISFDRALLAVQEGDVDEEVGMMRWGSNYTFLVNIIHDDLKFMGVYKPRMGERPLWDFPTGTLCQRETAAYTLSEALGWHIVPPTVLRDATRGIGSVQVFIAHDPETHYFTFDETPIPQLQRMAIFDAIANNADRKGGHCLLDPDDRLWGIDHGLTFNVDHKLRTVIWDFAGQEIREDLLQDLQNLCDMLEDETNPHTKAFKELLNEDEMTILHRRVMRLLTTKTYPMPGHGPNRPWPAV